MINIEELAADYMAIKEQNVKLKEAIKFYEELLNIALKQDDTKIVKISDKVILSATLFDRLMDKQNHSFTVVKKGEYSTIGNKCNNNSAENSHHACKMKCNKCQNQNLSSQPEDCPYLKELKRKLTKFGNEDKTSYSKDSIIRFTSEDQ